MFHAQQVDPDRQSATVSNKAMLKTATWNVRTLFQKGKLANAQQEMNRLGIDILGLSEIKWKGGGRINSESRTIIYSGGDSHSRGVGVILNKVVAAALIGYWAISERVVVVKIRGQPFSICIIQAYAPTATVQRKILYISMINYIKQRHDANHKIFWQLWAILMVS